MNFTESVKSVFHNYASISGRASRSEYWYFVLFVFIATGILSILDSVVFPDWGFMYGRANGPMTNIFYIVVLIPTFAVAIRRLHDLDKSGWWLLINLIPGIGGLIILFWLCQKGTSGGNRFGGDSITIKEKIVDLVGG